MEFPDSSFGLKKKIMGYLVFYNISLQRVSEDGTAQPRETGRQSTPSGTRVVRVVDDGRGESASRMRRSSF